MGKRGPYTDHHPVRNRPVKPKTGRSCARPTTIRGVDYLLSDGEGATGFLIERGLAGLNTWEACALEHRYIDGWTDAQIGAELGVTADVVSQICDER